MRDILRQCGIRPNHQAGQDFLCDEGVLRREVAYAEVEKLDVILEIGPGTGNLTRRLLSAPDALLPSNAIANLNRA